MTDLLNRANVDIAINTLLNDLQPNDAIQPSNHNGLLKDILDTLSNGLSTTLRTGNTTDGQNMTITSSSIFQFENGSNGRLQSDSLTAFRNWTLPDKNGTVAMLTDITGGDNLATADLTFDGDHYADLNGNEWTIKNASATKPTINIENTNANHNAILINKPGSLIAGEKSNIEFKVNGFDSSKIENTWHGANDIGLTFGTLSNANTLNVRNGKIGILDTSPSYELDVNGEIHSSLSGDAFTGLTLENTSANHTALRINKTGSLVAGEKSNIEFNVSGYFSSRIQNIWHGSNDMSLIFGTLAHLETFRIRNGKTIANGSNVIGSEGISLQDDTLIKGSNNAVGTSGFKVTDINDNSLLDVKNNGKTILGNTVFNPLVLNYNGTGLYGIGLDFNARNSSAAEHNFARIIQIATSTSSGNENGALQLRVSSGGTITTQLLLRHDRAEFSEKLIMNKGFDSKGINTSYGSIPLQVYNSSNTSLLEVHNNGVINASNLPTSSAGLISGDIWNNSGVLNIV